MAQTTQKQLTDKSQSRNWVFTIPNYTFDEYLSIEWGVFGALQGEIAPTTGTKHLQGFVCFNSPTRLSTLKAKYHASAHWERMRGSIDDNISYCSKPESADPLCPFRQWGTRALASDLKNQGNRTDLAEATQVLLEPGSISSRLARAASQYPDVVVKYAGGFEKVARWTQKSTVKYSLENLYPWQQELDTILRGPVDDRKIVWVWDTVGNKGKSSYVKHCLCNAEYNAIQLSGKVADMAYMYDEQSIVFFDVPRTQAENLDHLMSMAESLKNGSLVSTKYESRLKVFEPPHVVFFANVSCPFGKWSQDRLIEICLD